MSKPALEVWQGGKRVLSKPTVADRRVVAFSLRGRTNQEQFLNAAAAAAAPGSCSRRRLSSSPGPLVRFIQMGLLHAPRPLLNTLSTFDLPLPTLEELVRRRRMMTTAGVGCASLRSGVGGVVEEERDVVTPSGGQRVRDWLEEMETSPQPRLTSPLPDASRAITKGRL